MTSVTLSGTYLVIAGGGGGGGNLGTYTVNGSTITPGNSGDPDYLGVYGFGGAGGTTTYPANPGTSGLAVIYVN